MASNLLRLSVATSATFSSVAEEAAVPTVLARAKFSWESDHARDLVFKKGDIIEVLDSKLNALCPAAVLRPVRDERCC